MSKYLLSITSISILFLSTAFASDLRAQPANQKKDARVSTNWKKEDVKKMLSVLDKYNYPITGGIVSENPYARNVRGSALVGLVWNDTYVSQSVGKLFTLSLSKGSLMGDVSLDVSTMDWDEKEQKFIGTGFIHGRAYSHCPLAQVSANFKISPYEAQPFLGAFLSIEATFTDLILNTACKQIGSEVRTLNLNRYITNIEARAANAYTVLLALDLFPKLRIALNTARDLSLNAQAFFYPYTDSDSKKLGYDILRRRIEGIIARQDELIYLESWIKNLDIILGVGGSFNVARFNEPPKQKTFNKQDQLDQQDRGLLAYVAQARYDVIDLAAFHERLKNEYLPQYKSELEVLKKQKADLDKAEAEKKKAELEAKRSKMSESSESQESESTPEQPKPEAPKPAEPKPEPKKTVSADSLFQQMLNERKNRRIVRPAPIKKKYQLKKQPEKNEEK